MRPQSIDKRTKLSSEKNALEYANESNKQDFEQINGRWFPIREVMGTFPGKRTHLRADIDINDDNLVKPKASLFRTLESSKKSPRDLIPPIAICGAGRPSKSYPTGSGFSAVNSVFVRDTKKLDGAITLVDCYKCLKIDYMNTLYEQEVDAPYRTFTPSDQVPTYSSYGSKRTIDFLNRFSSSDISFVLQKGTIFIVFLKEEDATGKKIRFHFEVSQGEESEYRNDFLANGVSVKEEAPTNPESYQRRDGHVMIPMGRFGAFGSNDTVAAEKLGERYLDDKNAISSEDVRWVENYFESDQNPWRANEKIKDRRTQQEPMSQKPKAPNYLLTFEDLADYPLLQEALDRATDDAIFILEGMQEFLDLLKILPIQTFYNMDPSFKSKNATSQSYALKGIYEAVKRDRMAEYEKYARSLNEKSIIRRQKIFLNKLKSILIEKEMEENQRTKRRASIFAKEQIELLKTYMEENNLSPEDTLEYLRSQFAINSDQALMQKMFGLEQRGMEVIRNNPMSNRVLPLLERVEELDTLFLELEQEYVENRGRRLR